jgi:hypothetical protein
MKGMYGVETTHPATVIIVVVTLKIPLDLAIEGNDREDIEDMGLLSWPVSVLCQLERTWPFVELCPQAHRLLNSGQILH